MLSERLFAGIVAALADFTLNLVANLCPAVEIFANGAIARRRKFDRPIEGEPRHDFRMREMLRLATDLPNSVIRFLPVGFEKLHQSLLQGPVSFVVLYTFDLSAIHRREHLAKDVDLILVRSRIA